MWQQLEDHQLSLGIYVASAPNDSVGDGRLPSLPPERTYRPSLRSYTARTPHPQKVYRDWGKNPARQRLNPRRAPADRSGAASVHVRPKRATPPPERKEPQ